ncbi:hypothetical protein FIBSPDRAFT_878781 [Athelia psychrophila]|uniref:Uncharacterized protein n=1 Tax=Athelia psychrophila TaxID=1759441 RepID=A0A167UQ68_9AGAM|nr:hypothetical protein FIBSPDRAFT_878781 [Fibularhizoctonia sp. CBS 109695]
MHSNLLRISPCNQNVNDPGDALLADRADAPDASGSEDSGASLSTTTLVFLRHAIACIPDSRPSSSCFGNSPLSILGPRVHTLRAGPLR